jgi:hypothetical protein
MKLYLSERPSELAAACAQVPTRGTEVMQMQQVSIQLQEAQARIQGTNGFTATSVTAKPGTAKSPAAVGVDASGVPPRGRPPV